MNQNDILGIVDHTLLTQVATWEEIKTICDEGLQYKTASVCIPPSYVKQAREYVKDELKITTVIGFPNGYHTTKTKVFETENAIQNGADEIDMVINIGFVKDKKYDVLLDEIKQIREVCKDKILKVIVETCLLTEEEKIKMCQVVTVAKADYIKTSTGFSTSGATPEDVRLLKQNIGEDIKIKAAGGIQTQKDAEKLVEAGAQRLGTSKMIKLVSNK